MITSISAVVGKGTWAHKTAVAVAFGRNKEVISPVITYKYWIWLIKSVQMTNKHPLKSFLMSNITLKKRLNPTGRRQEQEAFDAMSKKLKHVHFSSTVKLNVGGHTFPTSVQTLTKDPNSMLAAMFSGRFDTKPAEDGAFFIDRDGTHFPFILNYLRTGKLTLPEGATFLKELVEEAEFYQIQGIIDELKSPESAVQASKPSGPFEDSEILTTEEHRRILIGWLSAHSGEWRLL